ncbi:MAG: hypothetical protein II200_00810 [Bacteroidaceae bacterium]|nr:hypothetical protein [Bacteroidaceae bacterium]
MCFTTQFEHSQTAFDTERMLPRKLIRTPRKRSSHSGIDNYRHLHTLPDAYPRKKVGTRHYRHAPTKYLRT